MKVAIEWMALPAIGLPINEQLLRPSYQAVELALCLQRRKRRANAALVVASVAASAITHVRHGRCEILHCHCPVQV